MTLIYLWLKLSLKMSILIPLHSKYFIGYFYSEAKFTHRKFSLVFFCFYFCISLINWRETNAIFINSNVNDNHIFDFFLWKKCFTLWSHGQNDSIFFEYFIHFDWCYDANILLIPEKYVENMCTTISINLHIKLWQLQGFFDQNLRFCFCKYLMPVYRINFHNV